MNSYNEDEAKQIKCSLLPQEEKRKLCLEMFVEVVNHANSYGNDKWGTYYERKVVRLLVGSLIVFTIERGCVWLALDKPLLEGSEQHQYLLERENSWQWDQDDYPTYSKVPSRNGYYIPSESHSEIWPIIRLLHFEFIRKVAEKYPSLRTTSQARHNSTLLSYLRNELEQFVPDPIYEPIEGENDIVLAEEVLDVSSQ